MELFVAVGNVSMPQTSYNNIFSVESFCWDIDRTGRVTDLVDFPLSGCSSNLWGNLATKIWPLPLWFSSIGSINPCGMCLQDLASRFGTTKAVVPTTTFIGKLSINFSRKFLPFQPFEILIIIWSIISLLKYLCLKRKLKKISKYCLDVWKTSIKNKNDNKNPCKILMVILGF